jgi:hypothetical protein
MADHFAQTGARDKTAGDVTVEPLREIHSPGVLFLKDGTERRKHIGALPGALGLARRAHAHATTSFGPRTCAGEWIPYTPPERLSRAEAGRERFLSAEAMDFAVTIEICCQKLKEWPKSGKA